MVAADMPSAKLSEGRLAIQNQERTDGRTGGSSGRLASLPARRQGRHRRPRSRRRAGTRGIRPAARPAPSYDRPGLWEQQGTYVSVTASHSDSASVETRGGYSETRARPHPHPSPVPCRYSPTGASIPTGSGPHGSSLRLVFGTAERRRRRLGKPQCAARGESLRSAPWRRIRHA